MSSISKTFTLILILIVAVSSLSLITIKLASAQTIPKPSIPEFTVHYADRSNDVPANTSIDPFTGKTVTNPAQHIENQTISSSDYLYYEIRMKGHFSQE